MDLWLRSDWPNPIRRWLLPQRVKQDATQSNLLWLCELQCTTRFFKATCLEKYWPSLPNFPRSFLFKSQRPKQRSYASGLHIFTIVWVSLRANRNPQQEAELLFQVLNQGSQFLNYLMDSSCEILCKARFLRLNLLRYLAIKELTAAPAHPEMKYPPKARPLPILGLALSVRWSFPE